MIITENYQYKYSDYIKYGKPPSIKKSNCITIDLLQNEYNKIIDQKFHGKNMKRNKFD